MIRKFTMGCPTYYSEACITTMKSETSPLPYLQVKEGEDIQFNYTMGKQDIVYGLGENVRGINKRGYIYTSKCNDEGRHTETMSSLYAAHNFIMIDGVERFAIFIDCPGIVTFDIGYQNIDTIHITCENTDLDIYIIEGDTLHSIISQFRECIGQSYLPPRWAFGYGQSRWGYKNSEDVRQIANIHKKNHIPLDAIYLDIDYMENYKNFTINREGFPDFEDLVKEMKDQDIHIVPIIDTGIRIEKGYATYEEGVKHNYFCKDKEGNDFVAGVWPGRCHFPDFLNKEAREWFGNSYKVLLDKGIEGFWNDMNEPSIFYTDTRLQQAFDLADKLKKENLNVNSFFQLVNAFSSLSNNRKDYELFYHNINGKRIRHDKVHNQFGYHMTRSAQEAFQRLYPDKRILLFSRSSSIGMHRYGGIWTGDNYSWWSHLLLNIKMMPSLNMCGFLYIGADLGGFAENTTEDLLLRWIQFGIFTPLMRNHSACEREQELFQFTNTPVFQHMISIRYALLPYLYSEFMKCALGNAMFFRPLSFDYEDDSIAKEIETQLMLGDSLMIAPIYEQNTSGRYVYLPDDMMLVRYRSLTDFDSCIMKKGHHYVPCKLHEVMLFVKENHVIPLCEPKEHVAQQNFQELSLLGYVNESSSYRYFDDDGCTSHCSLDHLINITVQNKDNTFEIALSNPAYTVTSYHILDNH